MISQRSVGRLQRLLTELMARPPQTLPLLSWPEYRTQLYEEGVDVHILDHIESEYQSRLSRFLPNLHNGFIPAYVYHNTGLGSQPAPNQKDLVRGQALLAVFMRVAIQHAEDLPEHLPEPKALANELIRSLEIDGYELVGGKLVPATLKGMKLDEEDDFLIRLIRALQPPNLDVIRHHHKEADETFVNGNWGSASSETRNFFVAVLRGLREAATSRGGLTVFTFGNEKGLMEDYVKIGLLTEEEKEAILKLWVLLSYSGSHVGIQPQHRARLTRLLFLGLTQWLCL